MNTWDHAPDIARHTDTEVAGFFGEYRWLSNFYLCPIKFDGLTYPSAENLYQALKWPPERRGAFLAISPNDAKKLGKQPGIDRPAWDAAKDPAMVLTVASKFSQNRDLRAKLTATGTKHLEETNWWGDRYWGVCEGTGENRLGKIHMAYRWLMCR